MPLRNIFATQVGKWTSWFLKKYTHGGTSLPGKLVLTIDPHILESLTQNYEIAIVTGTNGKTLTTALAVQALKTKYDVVVTNPSGSNMIQGIVGVLLEAPKLKAGQKGVAVLEVDEGSLKHIVKPLQPHYLVFTNIFRDQLDRYGEVYSIYQLLEQAALDAPNAKIIANGDLPLFNNELLAKRAVYFGFDHQPDQEVSPKPNTDCILCPKCDHPLKYKMITYANLGKYYCPECGFQRPELTYRVDKLDTLALTHSDFTIESQSIHLPIAGKYNIYNALAAFSLASELGLEPDAISKSLNTAQRVFGRQEVFEIDGKKILLNLVKNQVGLNQVIELISLDKNPFTLVALLNNDYADGVDVSWIWDGDFEQLKNLDYRQVFTAGSKKEEMTYRLKVAGIAPEQIQEKADFDAIIEAIKHCDTEYVHILATYTAMLSLRDKLIKAGYLRA